jgi:virginiamycin B lyase
LNLGTGFGSLWVSTTADPEGFLVRVDPVSERVLASIPVGGFPVGIVAAEGSIWVTNHTDGTLMRIDPVANRVVATIPVGPGPALVAFDSGMVWVANQDATLARVDPARNRRVQLVTVGRGLEFRTLAAGGGSVWTPNSDGTVTRLDSRTGRVQAKVAISNCCQGDVVLRQGEVWVSNASDGAVYGIDAATNRVTRHLRVGVGASDMAWAGGLLWVTHTDRSVITWHDPDTGKRLGSLDLDSFVSALAVTDDRTIWVQALDQRAAVRIAVR